MNKRDGVYRRGKIVYIRYHDECGRDVRESTRQTSLEFARNLRAKRRVEVAEGRHLRGRAFDRVTFKELRTHWWEQHGRKTRSQFHYLLPRIDSWFDDTRARDVTSDAVQRFLDHLSETEFGRRGKGGAVTKARLSPSSVNHYRTILNSIFSFAVRRGLYDLNPVRAVLQLREPPEREVVLLPHEFQRLLSEL